MIRRFWCWLSGFGTHRIDLVGVAFGAPIVCVRCGKNCGYSADEVARP